ncbi:PREDICTED: coiled-coil domain-containing protein 132 isoform X5 [Populus euphratica]|nr:PREDICTED: coiled-coil domain-containing protein 132 isoform X5 [Populus euphratica]XP_011005416.1 PREDICTED: coiled-coil domain-containing protein 132 isoform X5 [Populus euphratica]
MNLVREVEKDLKVANVICMNGRRHLTSSMNEVSRDLVVNTNSKRKQTLLDMLAVLTELRRALDMQVALESLVEEGNYCKAFQVLSEYLQLLDSFSELPAIQEMSRGVEVWLGRTLQKLDALLLGVCQEFKEESYITVVDAYALIGDISGLAEKLQSFYMQEVLSETHSVLKNTVQEDLEIQMQNSRLTYSDLSLQIPESKFRQCLLRTLAVLFRLISSYHEIMNFRLEHKDLAYQTSDMKQDSLGSNGSPRESLDRMLDSSPTEESTTTYMYLDSNFDADETRSNGSEASRSGSPWYHLRKDATAFVSQTLQRGRKNLWQLTTSRVSVLLSSAAISSMSTHQFLKNYEDLNVFILAGEAFCGVEAVEFRQKLKAVCENYFLAFHRQNIHALKMVLEKESWLKLPPDTVQSISFAGLVGNGAALIVPSHGISSNVKLHHSNKSVNSIDATIKKSGFTSWIKSGNPFSPKIISTSVEGHSSSLLNGATAGEYDGHANDSYHGDQASPHSGGASHKNGTPFSEDENEDLLADFIDEDSQLPSRISKPKVPKSNFSHCKDDEISAQTGSSLCLLRSMDKYARFMQKLEIVNVEFFKGICQLFEIFFYSVFETFGQQNSNSNGKSDPLNYRLKTAISRITQDCDQWIKPQLTPVSSSSPTSLSTYMHGDVTPASPPNHSTSFGLKERCAAADTISLVAQILHRSKTHLQSMLLQNNPAIVEDFFVLVVDSVPDVIEHLHRTTARLLLHINGRYVDRIANAKWEVKELGLEHNGYVDLLLGEFKHYKTRLAHGGIHKEAQDRLSEYGVEIVAETLIEGLSRVKRCSDEGRALMSLDLQVLINGLQHFVPINVKPKLQMVETFIKAYYLPETEYVHWARAHPEYTKNQIVGLINLVAAMKGWKRKTRLEVIEKIE